MDAIIRLFFGFLAEYILAFMKNLKAARADNHKLWEVAETIITQINVAHPDWPGEQKRSYAFDAIKVASHELLKDIAVSAGQSLSSTAQNNVGVADSTINTMIELIVSKIRLKA